jgi:Protein of unknown function (DUF2939)
LKKLVAILVFLMVAGFAALPYFNAYSLAEALKSGDRDTLESRVDWPIVRQKLKEELAAKMAATAFGSGEKTDRDASSGEALGKGIAGLLGPAMINNMVDSYVTPAGLAALVKNKKSDEDTSNAASKINPSLLQNVTNSVTWAFFESPTTFVVHLQPPDKPEVIKLKFGFYGTNWKLNGFTLPEEFYENK